MSFYSFLYLSVHGGWWKFFLPQNTSEENKANNGKNKQEMDKIFKHMWTKATVIANSSVGRHFS